MCGWFRPASTRRSCWEAADDGFPARAAPDELDGHAPPQRRVVREVDLAHAALAQEREDFAVAERFPRVHLAAGLPGGQGRHVEGKGWRLQKAPRLLLKAEQRLDLQPQRAVACASGVQERRPFAGIARERGLDQLDDTLGGSGFSHHARRPPATCR